jgi:hypothetical protein
MKNLLKVARISNVKWRDNTMKVIIKLISSICVGCDGRVICIETISYVPHHMILDLHTRNTRRHLQSSLWDLQTQSGLLTVINTKPSNSIFLPKHEPNFWFTASASESLILFSLSWMLLIYFIVPNYKFVDFSNFVLHFDRELKFPQM